MSYKKILENLKAVPENEKLLACHVYYYFNSDGHRECGCALGKGLPNLLKGKDLFARVSDQWDYSAVTYNQLNIATLFRVTLEEAFEGLTIEEACMLQKMNDSYSWDSDVPDNALINRHARYVFIVNWLETQDAR